MILSYNRLLVGWVQRKRKKIEDGIRWHPTIPGSRVYSREVEFMEEDSGGGT